MKKVELLSAWTIVAAIFSGCTTSEPGFSRIINEPEPVPAKTRLSFGVIGVVPANSICGFTFVHPVTTENAIVSLTAKSVQATLDASLNTNTNFFDDPLSGLGVGLIMASVYGVVGGFLASVPEADIKKAEKAMNAVIRNEPMEERTLAQIHRLIFASSTTNLVVVSSVAMENLQGLDATNANLHSLAGSGIDSILVLQLLNEQFVPSKGWNPPMKVDISMEFRIRRVSDGTDLFIKTLEYQGEQLQFTRWGADGARLFQAELEVAQRTFAQAILNELQSN